MHVGVFVERGVGADLEAGPLGRPDPSTAAGKTPAALDQPVVGGLHAVEVDVDEQPAAGRAGPAACFARQQAVGAEVDVLSAGRGFLAPARRFRG